MFRNEFQVRCLMKLNSLNKRKTYTSLVEADGVLSDFSEVKIMILYLTHWHI